MSSQPDNSQRTTIAFDIACSRVRCKVDGRYRAKIIGLYRFDRRGALRRGIGLMGGRSLLCTDAPKRSYQHALNVQMFGRKTYEATARASAAARIAERCIGVALLDSVQGCQRLAAKTLGDLKGTWAD